MKVKFYNKYSRPPCPRLDFSEVVSATDQQFKKDCDINEMLRVYRITGNLPNRGEPRFGDFSEMSDYMANLQRVDEIRDLFASLPAKDRARFDGDLSKFLAFCADPKNVADLIDLGIVDGKVDKPVTATAAKPSPGVEVAPPTT